jgi:hypothetical protein
MRRARCGAAGCWRRATFAAITAEGAYPASTASTAQASPSNSSAAETRATETPASKRGYVGSRAQGGHPSSSPTNTASTIIQKFCLLHKGDAHVPLSRLQCRFEGCMKSPVFGDSDKGSRMWCASHKEQQHVRLNSRSLPLFLHFQATSKASLSTCTTKAA